MRAYKQQLRNTLHRVVKTKDFDEFYDEISHNWQERAKRLQQRRWKKLEKYEDRLIYS